MKVFSFPEVVNENAARIVAGVVASTLALAFLIDAKVLLPVLSLGFWLRVGFGPKVSPLARLAVMLAKRFFLVVPVAGGPKRLAQAIGGTLTTVASVLMLFGHTQVGWAVAGLVAVFATLESSVAFCAACWFHGVLARD